jgi:hypothetical protein
MSSAEKAKFKREKTSGKRISYNHKRKEDGGEIGWLDQYQYAGEVNITQDIKNLKPQEDTFGKVLNYADLATDVMQAGHFIPHPIGQAVGYVGDFAGAGVDALQSMRNISQGNYTDAAVNAGLALLPFGAGKQGYKRANSLISGKGSGYYRPLQALPHLKNNPVVKKGIGWNRATLGANALEVGSNIDFNNDRSSNFGGYQDNTRVAPPVRPEQLWYTPQMWDNSVSRAKKNNQMQNGGWLDQYQAGGEKVRFPKFNTFLRTNPAGNVGYSDNTTFVNPQAFLNNKNRQALYAKQQKEEVAQKPIIKTKDQVLTSNYDNRSYSDNTFVKPFVKTTVSPEKLVLINKKYEAPDLTNKFYTTILDQSEKQTEEIYKDYSNSSKQKIIDLQNNLLSKGYDIGNTGADGIFGSKTKTAYKESLKDSSLYESVIGNYYNKYNMVDIMFSKAYIYLFRF